MEESKKISFGFSKVTRKPIASSKPTRVTKYNKIQLIDRLENQVIKTIEKPVVQIESSVVIPTDQNKFQNFLTKSTVKVETDNGGKPESELTEDEIAARELLKEAQNISDGTVALKPLMLPLSTESLNDVQSTLEDYEDVPIEQFGMAMLKQMGWKEGEVLGKNKTKPAPPQVDPNVQRRFGQMGLGCDISAKLNKTKNIKDEKDNKLVLKTGSFGKIMSGKYKSNYCEVQGFDIENPDSIIVKLSLTGKCVTIPDIYMELVTREEYNKSSKVINIAKYEEYKIKSETVTKMKRSSSCESDEDKHKASGSKSSRSDNSKHKKRKTSSSDSEEEKYREKGSKHDDSTRDKERRSDYEDKRRKRRKSSSESEGEKYKQKRSKSSKNKKSKRDYEEQPKRKSSSLESDNEKFKSKRDKSSKYESKCKESKRYDSSEEESKKYQKSHDKKKHKKHKRSYDSEENPKYKDSGRHSKYSKDRQRSDKKYK